MHQSFIDPVSSLEHPQTAPLSSTLSFLCILQSITCVFSECTVSFHGTIANILKEQKNQILYHWLLLSICSCARQILQK